MLMSWASHVLLRMGSTADQGFAACFLADYTGVPAHSQIPSGIEFTSGDDLAIESWLTQTTRTIQDNTIKKYIKKEIISRDQSYKILKSAKCWIYD